MPLILHCRGSVSLTHAKQGPSLSACCYACSGRPHADAHCLLLSTGIHILMLILSRFFNACSTGLCSYTSLTKAFLT